MGRGAKMKGGILTGHGHEESRAEDVNLDLDGDHPMVSVSVNGGLDTHGH